MWHVAQIMTWFCQSKLYFDEKISVKQKGTKQMNIDRKFHSHMTAVTAVFINSSKVI